MLCFFLFFSFFLFGAWFKGKPQETYDSSCFLGALFEACFQGETKGKHKLPRVKDQLSFSIFGGALGLLRGETKGKQICPGSKRPTFQRKLKLTKASRSLANSGRKVFLKKRPVQFHVRLEVVPSWAAWTSR